MATMNVIANWSDTETEPKSDSNEFDSLEWDEEVSNKGSDEDSSNEDSSDEDNSDEDNSDSSDEDNSDNSDEDEILLGQGGRGGRGEEEVAGRETGEQAEEVEQRQRTNMHGKIDGKTTTFRFTS